MMFPSLVFIVSVNASTFFTPYLNIFSFCLSIKRIFPVLMVGAASDFDFLWLLRGVFNFRDQFRAPRHVQLTLIKVLE